MATVKISDAERAKRLKYQRAWRKKRKMKAKAKLVEQTPPHLVADTIINRQRVQRVPMPETQKDLMALVLAQQGTIARLLTIIEAVVELG